MLSGEIREAGQTVANAVQVRGRVPGVGPEHSFLKEIKRVIYKPCTDEQAIQAFILLSLHEGIIPALESAHAISYGMKLAKKMPSTENVVITLSGRGDKDVEIVQKYIEK